MTPDVVEARKQAGLAVSPEDLHWLIEVCESLAKGLAGLGYPDFRCAACGRDSEQDHAPRCPVPLADAVLRGRWKVNL